MEGAGQPATTMTNSMRGLSRVIVLMFALACASAVAQGTTAKKQQPQPASKQRGGSMGANAASKDYRTGPMPAWVADPPPATTLDSSARTAVSAARRELLVDFQTNYALARPQAFFRHRATAADASTVGLVSQPQIQFNPSYQSVTIHNAHIVRDGRRLDRLKDARVEPMRREQRLEQLVIDGVQTLLVVLTDVRVGDVVEIAYTIEGENPIYEGRISTGMQLAWDSPIDVLHHRIIAPADRRLHVRGISTDLAPERFEEGGRQVIRIVRSHVHAIQPEQATPSWFKVYPALQITEFESWADVNAWASRLFAPAAAHGPVTAARVAAFKQGGLAGEALVADVLRFVQDEVRYFSASLGESSHRPKPAERTLTERLGDCKDKVVLLNALLSELGFDAKPALVSMARNRGLANYLPSYDQFDHVVTRLDLDGSTYYLDPTMQGQGTRLASRGYFPYGRALIVGGRDALEEVGEPSYALNQLEFEQRWDLSVLNAPARLTTVLRAQGLIAEAWRNGVARNGYERVAEAMAGAHARIAPGLRATGTPQVKDDRDSNVFELVQTFEHPSPGKYSRGGIGLEFTAIELLDALTGPPEATRQTPFYIDTPRVVQARIEVTGPRRLTLTPPAPAEINDRHFRFSSQAQVSGQTLSFEYRVERRADEVLPSDLMRFRENILRTRQQVNNRVRLALVDVQALMPELENIDRRRRASRGFREDTLHDIVLRNEIDHRLDSEVLEQLDRRSPLAAQVLASRAEAGNLLADFAGSLADADAALAIDPQSESALEARAVSLTGMGRDEEALADFARLSKSSRRGTALHWMGSIELLRQRPAEAEKHLRQAIDASDGEAREFALLWLYIAAEHQGGRGRSAIAPYVDSADSKKLSGAILHYLDGRIDRDALLKQAGQQPKMERLNLAEAYFYIGQQLAARGQRDEALRWFQRTVETQAVPYREVTFARLELERGR